MLLSCSHVFHAACIDALERFNDEAAKLCPMCRGCYHKRMWDEDEEKRC